MYFKTSAPTLDTNSEKSAEQILSYTEEIRRETEAKISAMENKINRIISQLDKIREVIS